MAFGETAKLLASLELQDKFSKTADKFSGAVSGMERQTSTLGRVGGEVTRGTQAAVTNLTKIGLVAGGVIAHSVFQGVQSLQRLEEVTVATNTVIESTRGVAGQTAESIRNLAEKYESLNATMDDKVIQSGANLLLTFTQIRKDAFEPALEAALNMNQAMGGGEEGLESTIIQVGKALNDPIKGVTALRRVGVQLTEQQEDQIKTLVEQNDLYGAQQVILGELTTQFGNQFAAAGDTATGKMAKFRDAVEDAQMSLAGAFLPVMERVADKLTTFLSDPKVQRQIAEFGEGLAGGLEQVIEFAGKLPWSSIGDAFRIAGTGAKAVLDAFTALPSWLQTAVLTGWGLNKLTGGALGNIGKIVGQAAFGRLRGATPANPVFTKEVGIPGVGGGGRGGVPLAGAPAAAAAGGGLAGALALGGGVLLPFAMFNLLPELFKVEGAKPVSAERTLDDGTVVKLDSTTTAMLTGLMPGFQAAVKETGGRIVDATDKVAVRVGAADESIDQTRSEVRDLQNPIKGLAAVQQRVESAIHGSAAGTYRHLAEIQGIERGTQGYTAQVAAKDFSPNVSVRTDVTANISVSATQVARSIQIRQSAAQTSFTGRGGDQRF